MNNVTFFTANLFYYLYTNQENLDIERINFYIERINSSCETDNDTEVLQNLLTYRIIQTVLAPCQYGNYIIEHLTAIPERQKNQLLWSIEFFNIIQQPKEAQLTFIREKQENLSLLTERQVSDLMRLALNNDAWDLVAEITNNLEPNEDTMIQEEE